MHQSFNVIVINSLQVYKLENYSYASRLAYKVQIKKCNQNQHYTLRINHQIRIIIYIIVITSFTITAAANGATAVSVTARFH